MVPNMFVTNKYGNAEVAKAINYIGCQECASGAKGHTCVPMTALEIRDTIGMIENPELMLCHNSRYETWRKFEKMKKAV